MFLHHPVQIAFYLYIWKTVYFRYKVLHLPLCLVLPSSLIVDSIRWVADGFCNDGLDGAGGGTTTTTSSPWIKLKKQLRIFDIIISLLTTNHRFKM